MVPQLQPVAIQKIPVRQTRKQYLLGRRLGVSHVEEGCFAEAHPDDQAVVIARRLRLGKRNRYIQAQSAHGLGRYAGRRHLLGAAHPDGIP